MTFSSSVKSTDGIKLVQVVELVLDFCAESYGIAPCTAVIPTTGNEKCYNTWVSCQDTTNYNKTAKTYRFHTDTAELIADSIPSILSIDITPQVVENDGRIGGRSTVSIKLQDHPDDDTTVDPYVSSRSRVPLETSTYWRKWVARNPYYRGRKLYVRNGVINSPFSWSNFEDHLFFIEAITFSGNDVVTIQGSDILKPALDTTAKIPLQNSTVLSADIGAGDASFSVNVLGYSGNIDDEFELSGTIRVGEELMAFTRAAASTTLSVTRGTNGTTAVAHSTGDTVQQCYVSTAQNFWDVIYDILINPSSVTTHNALVASTYVDYSEWNANMVADRPLNIVSRIISEPEDVKDVIANLCQINQANLFWREDESKLKLEAVQLPTADLANELGDDSEIFEGSYREEELINEQVTQVWIAFDMKDPLGAIDDIQNFRTVRAGVDVQAESENEYDISRAKVIYAPWFTASQESIAINLAFKLLQSLRDPPKRYGITTHVKDAVDYRLGDSVILNTREFVNIHGESSPVVCFVESREMDGLGLKYKYRLRRVGFRQRYARFMNEATAENDFIDASSIEKTTGAYFCDASGKMTDSSKGYLFS